MPTNDYILRNDALIAVQECFDKELDFSYDNAQSCMNRINTIPATEMEPKRDDKWISVTDFLPSAGGEYWTLRYSERLPIVQLLKYGVPDGFDNEYFYAHNNEWGEDTIYSGITHWLPLSALPELPERNNK